MAMKTCPQCKALMHELSRTCPACDHRFAGGSNWGLTAIVLFALTAAAGTAWMLLR
jgi:RNA polymerase subunit RPABC4/transcription elongation factor Spt4